MYRFKKYLLGISAIISLTLMYLFSASTKSYGVWYLIPFVYGLCYFILIPNNIFLGPGFTIANIVLFLRYLVYPVLLGFDGLPTGSHTNYWPTAVILSILEIVILLTAFRLFAKRRKKTSIPKLLPKSYISFYVIMAFIGVYFAILFVFPDTFSNRHFILNNSLIISDIVATGAGQWGVAIKWIEYFIILALLGTVYQKKQSYAWCFLILILPRLFYEGHSRLSILTPLVVSIFLLLSLFPQKRKLTLVLGIALILTSMTLLTMVKMYKTDVISEVEISNPSKQINSYFGGVDNIARGIASYESNDAQIDKRIIVNDMLRNMLVVNRYVDTRYSSPAIYNQQKYGYRSDTEDQIIPTICQSIYYFGYALFGILSIIMVWVTCYADKRYYRAKSVEDAGMFGMMGATIGWAIPGSFQHLYMFLYYTFIPMWIIIKAMNIKIKWH